VENALQANTHDGITNQLPTFPPPNTDIYGFSALPGGEVTTGIAFGFLGNYAFFMSSTEISSTTYKIWEFDCLCNFSNRTTSKDYGYSVRCIKEE